MKRCRTLRGTRPFQVPSGEWEEGAAPQYAPEVSEYACAGGALVLRDSRCLPSVEAAVRALLGPHLTLQLRVAAQTQYFTRTDALHLRLSSAPIPVPPAVLRAGSPVTGRPPNPQPAYRCRSPVSLLYMHADWLGRLRGVQGPGDERVCATARDGFMIWAER